MGQKQVEPKSAPPAARIRCTSLVKFNFPATRFAQVNDESAQIAHVLSEAKEVREALEDRTKTVDDVLEELADLDHSLETLWRILTAKHGEGFVVELFDKVVEKNRRRGYYQGGNDAAA